MSKKIFLTISIVTAFTAEFIQASQTSPHPLQDLVSPIRDTTTSTIVTSPGPVTDCSTDSLLKCSNESLLNCTTGRSDTPIKQITSQRCPQPSPKKTSVSTGNATMSFVSLKENQLMLVQAYDDKNKFSHQTRKAIDAFMEDVTIDYDTRRPNTPVAGADVTVYDCVQSNPRRMSDQINSDMLRKDQELALIWAAKRAAQQKKNQAIIALMAKEAASKGTSLLVFSDSKGNSHPYICNTPNASDTK